MLTVPLFKSAEQDPSLIRPVGMKSSFVRTLHKQVVINNRGVLREYLEPQQLALAPGGAAKLVHTVRMTLEANPDFICVALDMCNAHNEVSRKSVVKGLERQTSLRHMAQHVATCLCPSHRLESGGEAWGVAEEGLTQGDPEAGFSYCVACHEEVKELDQKLAESGGKAVFGNDDGYALGPAEIVFDAVARFQNYVKRNHGLTLQILKTKVYHCSGLAPAQTPVGMKNAGVMVGQQWLPGFVCYGVAIGSVEYVKHILSDKVETLGKEIDKVMELLVEDNQSAWLLLSTALSQQLDYSLSLQYPSDILEAAEILDARLWTALEQVCGQHIPKGEEGLGVECVLQVPGVPELVGRSFQRWLVAQPVKLGGLGLRSLVETCPAAVLGGLEMALPHMVGDDGEIGICPQLENIVGSVRGEERWQISLAANSRTSREFSWAWNQLATEAKNTWQCLEKQEGGVLAAPVESAGGNHVDGKTRREVVEQQEGLRHELLTWSLAKHPDRLARPVTVYQNLSDEKVAGHWLLATPGSDLNISGSAFQEAMSAHLCLPSPAVVNGGWVGKPVGRRGEVIDKFGDSMMNCQDIFGDTWCRRHDNIKQQIVSEALISGIHVDCEVYGQFSDLLPATLQEDGGELQWGRARQGVVPDFKFMMNSPDGPQSSLAELKTISAGKTRYPRGVLGKGTDRRAALISKEYETKLRKYDVRFHGTSPLVNGQPEPPAGPLLS